jgi:hypothetical protein
MWWRNGAISQHGCHGNGGGGVAYQLIIISLEERKRKISEMEAIWRKSARYLWRMRARAAYVSA